MEAYPRTWIDIDLSAIGINLAAVRARIGPEKLLSMVVKADGYGHGIVPISRYAETHGADWLCVATAPEAIAIREAGVQCPILILSPILPVESDQAVHYDLRVSIESLEAAKSLSEAGKRLGKTAFAHLEVDTGIARFGCRPEDTVELVRQISQLPNLKLEGLSHHYVDSSTDAAKTIRQADRFGDIVRELDSLSLLPDIVHSSNSAGAMKYPEHSHQMVRVGIVAYGIDLYGLCGGDHQRALTWYARVIALRDVKAGETVGYSSTYVCPNDSKIATLGVGYGDGYPRSLSSKGFVRVKGVKCPVVGLVCMDQMMVDVTSVPDIAVGDTAVIVGDGVRIEDLSPLAETNLHEIPTRIGMRVPKRYLNG